MLAIENCRLTWPDFTADYTLQVKEGTFCAVVGPSGGGKTTLLHMIAGFETPESGTLAFRGRSLLPLSPAERPVAIVFQDHNLFPHLAAAENVALGIRPSLRLSSGDRARVTDMLEAVGLKGFENRRPGEMSGGQRQRVALARALISGRPLILLDEPFSSLDPHLRRSMVALVDKLRREKRVTVIMSIHTPEDVRDLAEQMVLVAGGGVVATGSPSAILHDPSLAAAIAAEPES
ncbi:ATP-binding cassette domain-containing protein [Microvirga thermotolerans]|uniref:ATP-binding cassette domain-containing protein n=1 Tax=Microvirga thermotolerans TaxID=2651334 RepID=A0A5P9K5C0_9HYPH|nr:ATP-binding cassette domain-containing protein [Microvirga thermotolerans]QFU17714.1 ATP-binding cassette domain-containing protein [Microvirga thermotolerans]